MSFFGWFQTYFAVYLGFNQRLMQSLSLCLYNLLPIQYTCKLFFPLQAQWPLDNLDVQRQHEVYDKKSVINLFIKLLITISIKIKTKKIFKFYICNFFNLKSYKRRIMVKNILQRYCFIVSHSHNASSFPWLPLSMSRWVFFHFHHYRANLCSKTHLKVINLWWSFSSREATMQFPLRW